MKLKGIYIVIPLEFAWVCDSGQRLYVLVSVAISCLFPENNVFSKYTVKQN